ncbi:uncharacterized protein LAESUDRAFT_719092 [Laetiporus sulphureus 93-53]|uniref:DNA replication checkpoint mediator MRC1 domain-containing protein n=1 Tax=Laetiporus sulphureus 93-53 TaxID=1314785 RepID=A0A165I9U8_9APHY|nr:uncharacterized protein LAESUDRAFT_719092 [Laetiporus sulphureus 93-53]KZT12783.1 hypothetical protein LAESUDRAFT_719092 [Laetiporus sulphureus 93-53]
MDLSSHTAAAPHEASSPSDSATVKRARVTYGRRRETLSDREASTSTASMEVSSRVSSYGMELPGKDNGISHGSDGRDAFNFSTTPIDDETDSDTCNVAPSSRTGFQFSWRKALKDIDYVYLKNDASTNEATGKNADADRGVSRAPTLKQVAERAQIPDGPIQGHESAEEEGTPSDMTSSADNRATSPSSSAVISRLGRSTKAVDGSDDETSGFEKALSSVESTSLSLTNDSVDSFGESSIKKGKQGTVEESSSDDELPEAYIELDMRKARRKKQHANGGERRVKAPTKKQCEETHKATARIIADRAVSIPRAQAKQLGLTQLWEKIGRSVRPAQDQRSQQVPPSDPIQPFSSPALKSGAHSPASASPSDAAASVNPNEREPSTGFIPTTLLGLSSVRADIQDWHDSSDSELPTVSAPVEEDTKKREESERKKRLAQLKRQYMERTRQEDSDASDLEVISSTGKHRQSALSRSIQRLRAQAHTSRPRGEGELRLLKASTAPAFARLDKEMKESNATHLSKDQLNKMLLQKAGKQAEELVKVKEEEWISRGGKIKVKRDDSEDGASVKDAVLSLVSKGLLAGQRVGQDDTEKDNGEDEEDDEDYAPEQEQSDHPEGNVQDENGRFSDAETQVSIPYDRGIDSAEDAASDNDEEADLYSHKATRPRRTITIVQSDDEDEATSSPSLRNREPLAADGLFWPSSSRSLAALHHRSSISSFEDPMESGTDKENDERMMYDRGEDKENTVVHTQSSMGLRVAVSHLRSSFGLVARDRSPLPSATVDHDLSARTSPADERRPPLKELSREDDDFDDSFALSTQPRGRGRKLLFGPDRSSEHALPSSPSLVDHEREDKEPSPLSTSSLAPPAMLTTDLSEFFEPEASRNGSVSMDSKQLKKEGLSQFHSQATDNNGLAQLRQAKPTQRFSLTLDAGLEPTLDVNRSLLRKAGDIFEKEQGFLAESFGSKIGVEPQLYVNEHGFLTQTVSNGKIPTSSPLLSPSLLAASSPFARDAMLPQPPPPIRQPLVAIDADVEMDGVDELPRRRLFRREISPFQREDSQDLNSSSSKPSKTRNAFDLMKLASRGAQRKTEKVKKTLVKSDFIEGEAEESDDDALMGFGGRKEDEDEDDEDENQNQTLAELVDDRAMDEKMLAEEAVLEKVREHQQEDDQALEKLHRDAAEGKLRVKRRDRGVGFEDSESDEDEEDARARRRKMIKKRKIDHDSLDQLSNDPSTRAFYDAYNADNIDDDDFEHLQEEQDEETLVGSQETDPEAQTKQSVITVSELRHKLREAAQEAEPMEVFDPHDVAWMERDIDEDDEAAIQVKEVTTTSKPVPPQQNADWEATLMKPRHPSEIDEEQLNRLQGWAKGESRTVSTVRATRASAVTGPGKRAAGSGSVRGHGRGQRAKSGEGSATRAPKASALSAVSTSRRARFRD